jgi:hypothetical protein
MSGLSKHLFIELLIGISYCAATTVIRAASLTHASITSASPTPSTRIITSRNGIYRNVDVAWNFQGNPKTTRRSAAEPCVEKGKRYVDCGDGTVTDMSTGLIWLKNSSCLGTADWETAKKAAATLKHGDCMLADGSSPGDWRLPTRAEWEDTMRNALALRCNGPTLTNDEGTACISTGPSSFTGVESDYYWSSTVMEGGAHAWFGDLDHGHLLNGNLFNTLRVWPVRGAQR